MYDLCKRLFYSCCLIALNIVFVVEAKQADTKVTEDQKTLLASPGRQLQVTDGDSDTESDTSIVLYETNL